MRPIPAALMLALATISMPACAASVSTHVLDISKGVGRAGVPVTLERPDGRGGWLLLASAGTDKDGRIRSFGPAGDVAPGTYRLRFDMAAAGDAPFYPEIDIVFRVTDAAGHYHVPIAVSPYGYSTYRGN